MRYTLLSLLFVFAFCSYSSAQEAEIKQDTIIFRAPLLDSAFLRRDIFSILREGGPNLNRVSIDQSDNLLTAFNNHIALAVNKKITGYRLRIFFDNKQDARVHSSSVVNSFSSRYPEFPVYRTYENPYFKVTVGDFRTKSEATMLLKRIESEFQSAFIIKETINFPPL